ncbi:hypothetical protein QAD02_007403 [Eretmocerus hayati]|uniref:Uncharacterized protein n=1 Tax=Eretmocerus hayati TaxID=131215 RepID=A0ACC2N4W7_9HYME|nr:hypothetical protein QAD02_007403 [Eretmocerus hayati]
MSRYDEYLDAQIGGGINSLDNLGSLCTAESCQRGSGIEGFLGGVYQRVLPILKRGSKAVGKEVMRAGYNVVSDIAHGGEPDDIQSLPNSEPESTESSGKKKESNRTPKTQKKQNRKAVPKKQTVKDSQKKLRAIKDIFRK